MHTIEHNVETSEIKEILLTDAQIKSYEAEAVIIANAEKLQQQTQTQKATAKAALLARMGLTEDEARLLLL